MKLSSRITSALIALLPTHSMATEERASDWGEVSGSIGAVSDYVYRGISQTREKPAAQAGLEYRLPIGAYLGAWSSNVDFAMGDGARVEVDGYAGFTHSFLPELSGDARITYFAYPGAVKGLHYDYYELSSSLTYDATLVAVTGGINYSPKNFGDSGDAVYVSLGVDVPIREAFKLSGRIGRQTIDDAVAFGVPSYSEWMLGVSYTWQGATIGLQYTDTNLRTGECSDGCSARGILSVTYAF